VIIDTHTHFYPENIAQYTIEYLEEESGMKALGNGTVFDLKRSMEERGISISINLPIATKPDQVMGINRKMIKYNENPEHKKVISFGTIHPDFSSIGNVREELEFLKEKQIKGIKMHPEYQEFYPDDPKMTDIYEGCRDLGLIVYFHAGRDIGFDGVHGTPKRFGQIKAFEGDLKVVLAHMGGWLMWDDVEKYLMGMHGVYFDTGFCLEMEEWQMKEIIYGHGPYKILFGSDYPWTDPVKLVEKIKGLNLGEMFETMIFYKNAERLLELNL
jgi:hypothetical protein